MLQQAAGHFFRQFDFQGLGRLQRPRQPAGVETIQRAEQDRRADILRLLQDDDDLRQGPVVGLDKEWRHVVGRRCGIDLHQRPERMDRGGAVRRRGLPDQILPGGAIAQVPEDEHGQRPFRTVAAAQKRAGHPIAAEPVRNRIQRVARFAAHGFMQMDP